MALHPSTLRVLPGALRPEQGEEVTVEHVQQALNILKRYFAYVVVDTSSSFADTNIAALEASERVLFLVTPELTALRAAIDCHRIFAEVIHLPPDRVLYVLNQLYGFRGLSRSDFEQAFKLSVDAELPHGGDVPIQAALRGQAFVASQPGTPIARAVDDLARTLTGAPKRAQTGFFRR
jgi:pilus assembly protein CpaE